MLDDATLDAWAASRDPVRRRHAANFRALKEGRTAGPPASPSFPPLAEQAANLAGAVGRFVASGGAMTTPEERERRLTICAECPHYASGPPGRCTLCGCVAQLAARVASKHCPDTPPRW